jgi:hypothetical protein
VQVAGPPEAGVQGVFWPALAGLVAVGVIHLAVVAKAVWQQEAGD